METVIITGGAGFIGSNFVRHVLARPDRRVVVLDKLTYAGHRENLAGTDDGSRLVFVEGDIADPELVGGLFERHQPGAVINFAAESHVDRSIDSPRPFVDTNIVGTFVLLEACRQRIRELPGSFRFLHVSTDEVFGSLGESGAFSESTPYAPNSPYAATKASADHLVRAYHHTYALPTLLTNCSNNYGPYQFPEKLIPLMTLNALEGRGLPIYGDGMNVRDWLYVEDHCEGILLALERGKIGESYNIGGAAEKQNVEVVDAICDALQGIVPAESNPALSARGLSSYRELKTFVPDRLGHDRRYAIDAGKIRSELRWQPRHDFASGIESTVRWYVKNRDWCEAVQRRGRYDRERLGSAGDPAEDGGGGA